MNVRWLIVHSMMSWPASVAMARYSPLIRREGIPTTAPMSAAMRPPARRLTGHGEPSRAARGAAVEAPTDMEAPWPGERSPEQPDGVFRAGGPPHTHRTGRAAHGDEPSRADAI